MILFAIAQIIGGIVPNLIAFGLFLGAIGYFALTGKMAETFGMKNKNLQVKKLWLGLVQDFKNLWSIPYYC